MQRAPESTVRPGDIVGGKYRVERILGKGAMGVVVSALHLELEERRAIKLMLPSVLGDRESVERFFREARAAARLRSSHAAIIHDIGRLDSGAPFIVMEHLDGTDLKRILEARGHLPIGEAVTLLLQACEAIGEAHSLGIIHRDLKPGNLFVARSVSGEPLLKVVDFGIAKVPDRQGSQGLTRVHTLLGTPLYMSPEQMRGASAVDARSDVWSLGAILYRMVTGETPFSGDNVPTICSAVLYDEPVAPSQRTASIPPALDAAILRCLAKDPADRFASVAEFAAAIRPFAGAQPDQGAAAPSPPPVERRAEISRLASTFVASASAPSAPSAPQETKNSTVRGSSWTPGPASSRTPTRSALLVAAVVIVAGVGAWFATQSSRSPASRRAPSSLAAEPVPDAASASLPSSGVQAAPAPLPEPAASAAPSASAAAPASAPSPSTPAAPTSTPAAIRPTPAPVVKPTASQDAFGRSRE